MMGSPTTESGHNIDETQHQVTLTHGIYVQTTEVTNQQYMELAQWALDHGYLVMREDSYGAELLCDNLDGSTQRLMTLDNGEIFWLGDAFVCIHPTHPVNNLTWYGSVAYCDWLSLQQGLPRAYNHSTWQCNAGSPYTATGYRLPTEAEWEYACRAGTQTPFNTGPCLDAGTEANYNGLEEPYPGCQTGPYAGGTVPVGCYPANAFGLYDMHGNLAEWCNDYHYWMYGGTVTDPVGAPSGMGGERVYRGGSQYDFALNCRSAWRSKDTPGLAFTSVGFRPVRSSDPGVPQSGTITINPDPNSVPAPWQIEGPNGFSEAGTGDTTLANMAVGGYTLTWGAVSGWTTPIPAAATQTLALGDVVTFAGLYVENVVAPIGFVSIPPGTFMMGSPTTEVSRSTGETQHQVTLTHGIYMQTTEVTNQQYRDMAQWAYNNGHVTATTSGLYDKLDGSTQLLKALGAGNHEITFSAGVFSCINPTHPVKYVTWYGSVAYCDWLSLQQGLPRAYNHSTWDCTAGSPYTATGYRLPTEAEWEYACRAGTQTPYSTGACLDAGTEANYDGSHPYTGCPTGPYVGWTVPVGIYPANAFGLFDMHGNLREWCNDWYGTYGGTVTDPVGAGAGSSRVLRGGLWAYEARYCRSADRYYNYPYYSYISIGFRPVRSA
jgi:formylglycine-generating enzyme required for sulfatase activity